MPKSGKTTTASQFDKTLILAFEIGFNAIPGAMAKPIQTWSEFKKVINELKDPEVQEMFHHIAIDTVDIAYSLCEKYVCNREGVDTIGDIPYGAGYGMVSKEFDEALRKIEMMMYGIILISHSQDKTFKDETGKEYNQIVPTVDKRGRLICERFCDIIGYSTTVETESGPRTKLFLRGTPRFVAGARFKYVPDSIDFTYQNLVDVIAQAIDKEAKEYGNKLVTDSRSEIPKEVTYDFEELQKEFDELVNKLMTANQSNANKIVAIVDECLGKGKKVKDCTPSQAEQVDLIVSKLKELL